MCEGIIYRGAGQGRNEEVRDGGVDLNVRVLSLILPELRRSPQLLYKVGRWE
jgi:hypothetical protein